MTKTILFNNLTNVMLESILEFDSKLNYSTCVTFDTETTTVTKSMNKPMVVNQYITVGKEKVCIQNNFDNYSFVCAWTVSMTNNGKDYYTILGRSGREIGQFFNMLRECAKNKLIKKLLELKSESGSTIERSKYQGKITKLKRNENMRLGQILVFVHNLVFDWMFTKDQLLDGKIKKFGQSTSLYYAKYGYKDSTRINKKGNSVYVRGYLNITFRDSLKYFDCKLSKISTSIFTKTDGWNYKKFRTISDKLTDDEIEYVSNDTLKLVEAIYDLSKKYSGVHNIPLTKTGIVREYFKGKCNDEDAITSWNKEQIERYTSDCADMEARMSVNLEYKRKKDGTYQLDKFGKKVTQLRDNERWRLYDQFLHVLFEGGVSQGNKDTFKKIMTDLYGYDVASMYPFLMSVMKYVRHYDKKITKIPETNYTFYDYLEHKVKRGWIGLLKFDKITVKKDHQIYDLSETKIIRTTEFIRKNSQLFSSVNNPDMYDSKVYNGKIHSAKNVYIAMNDLDYIRLKNNYDFSSPKLLIGWSGEYEDMPTSVDILIDHFASDKIKYKALVNENKNNMTLKEFYETKLSFAKKNFNSCYGFLVDNHVKHLIEEIADSQMITKKLAENSDEFKRNYNKYLKKVYGEGYQPHTYEMGVQVTAYARLYYTVFSNYIETHGCLDNYGDTDSHKTNIKPELIDKFNAKVLGIVQKMKPDKLKVWGEKPLGVWECEGKYPQYIHFNSKRYIHTEYLEKKDEHGKKYYSNEVAKIYVYYDENNRVIRRSSKEFKCYLKYAEEQYNAENIEQTEKFVYVDKLCKHFNLHYKVVEALNIKWAGLDGEILEYMLYDKYNSTIERMNNVFDESGNIYIPAAQTDKLTHVLIDLYKTRYNGNTYPVDKVEFVNNPYDATSCQVLLPQDYSSNILSTQDQIRRILVNDDSLVSRV